MSEEQQKSEEIYVAENAAAEADTIFGSTLDKTEAPVKKAGLSRNSRWLIIGGCVLLLLAGGLTATILLGDKDEEPAVSVGTEPISLNDGDMAAVRSVEIRGEADFTVSLISEDKDSAAGVYGIDGYEDVTLDADLLSTLIRNGNVLEADSLVAEKADADPAIFGLAEPRADVTMHYADGKDFSFRIGDPAPTGSGQTYCEVDGSIYLVRNSLLASYLKTPQQFVSAMLLEKPAQSDYPIVESVRIERSDLDYDIYLEYDKETAEDDSIGGSAATHVMIEPSRAFLSPDRSTGITHGMFGLTALEVPIVHPTDKDFADTGLDEPFCTVTMRCDDGNSYRLLLGDAYVSETGTECYYARFQDVPVIYGLTRDDAAWGTIMPNDITSANIFVTMVWNIGTLDIRTADGDFLFEGEGTDKTDYVVKKNGKDCETERFRQLYHFLLSIYGEEMYYDALPSGEPDAEVHLVSQNGKDDYTVSFYKLSDMKTLISRDGTNYVIRTSCLNTLLHNLEIIDDPEAEISMTWQ